jgi:release factor glutamine methyltransferase
VSPEEARRAGEQLVRTDGDHIATALGIADNEARREVRLLLACALSVQPSHLLAHPELAAAAHANARYREFLERRLKGEPVAYIAGQREFYGLTFEVSPAVLIPRPETELVVELALSHLPEGEPAQVLDLGTGSGCIAISIAKLRPMAQVFAVDISAQALEVAARNAARHGVANLTLMQGSWFEPVAHRRFDVIVSNPPYVAVGDPHLQQGDARFEPKTALESGPDGLQAVRIILSEAPAHLNAGGWLILEHGYDQQRVVEQAALETGFGSLLSHTDLAGIPRVVASQWLTVKR